MRIALSLLLILFIAWATSIDAEYIFKPKKIFQEYESIDGLRTMTVDINYLVIENEQNPEAAQNIRQTILCALDSCSQNYKNICNDFLKMYRVVENEFDEGDRSLSISVKHVSSSRYICIELTEWTYTGGLHGIYWSAYFVFDKQTGEQLKIDQIFPRSYMPKLTKMAEKELCNLYGISRLETYEDKGLFMKEFYLPDNFLITDEALIFLYNVYEIAPYSDGGITLEIPLSKLASITKNTFI